jgi:hypothetical protein
MQSYSRSTTNYVSRQTTNTIQSNKKAPFCNACFKAGKNEGEYTSHFTRSSPGPNGIVVCPTVLSASCNYCGKSGHWANEKHCPAMKADLKSQEKMNKTEKQNVPSLPKKEETKKGGFAALAEDDDDDFTPLKIYNGTPSGVPLEIQGQQLPINELNGTPLSGACPISNLHRCKPTTVVGLKRKREEKSWASIASQPAKLVFVEDKPIYFSQNPTAAADEGQKEAQKIFQERRREMRMKRSWADNDSSDDEEAVDYCLGNSAW